MNIFKFFKKEKEENLLVIKQKDVNSVPKVFYKGKEIPLKQYIYFQWDTEEIETPCGTKFDIQYCETKENGNYQITREGFSHPSQEM
ncbi:hypothetical protein K0O13_13255 [Mammaliicoccus sciuri]|uniref:hypothetical protein n=1 Tax=Mammaliicoccus sciuri TaxID=1296 RepID=UPI0019520429|nr:hypothetical protein [Mammaliicoccus sciuri]QYG30991.1 hypothetical protein K0O13_13255 [Mammaliicoccus sciuri]